MKIDPPENKQKDRLKGRLPTTTKLGEPPTVLGTVSVNLHFRVTTDLLPVTLGISFACTKVSYILHHKEYALFNMLLLFSMMFLRFIHVVA